MAVSLKSKTQVEVHSFVPSCELEQKEVDGVMVDVTPEVERLVFKYRDLLPDETLTLSDGLYRMSNPGQGVDQIRPAQTALETVLLRLVGWKNLKDEDGNDVNFPSSKVKLKEILNCLPYDVFLELINKVGVS